MKRSIKDIIVDAKDATELMVDLAWAAVLFDDREIAREVRELEVSVHHEVYELRRLCLIASRSPEDAEFFAGILKIGAAMENMGEAAEDIARVVLKRLGVPYELRQDLRHADEVIGRVPLPEGSPLVGANLEDLAIPRETGTWVIGIKRGLEWVFAPERTEVLTPGDVLYVQGDEEGVQLLREKSGIPLDATPDTSEWAPTDNLSVAVDLLVELKNTTEVAVGLAYSALLLRDRSLAREVVALEDRTDELFDELEGWVLAAARTEIDPFELRGLLRIGSATERMADAAQEVVWIIEHDEELHPIVGEALAEADEIVGNFTIAADSPLAGQALGESRVGTETGMYVLAVQRGNRWRYRPRKGFTLEAGDRVVATGPEDGVDLLADLADPRAARSSVPMR